MFSPVGLAWTSRLRPMTRQVEVTSNVSVVTESIFLVSEVASRDTRSVDRNPHFNFL